MPRNTTLAGWALPALLFPTLTWGQAPLPGTSPLSYTGDPAATMVESINTWLLRETEAAVSRQSGTIDRERLKRIIGAVDPRVPVIMTSMEIGRAGGYRVLAVRWSVFDDVEAEGVLLEPSGTPRARVVALPDPDETAIPDLARRLASSGCQVLVPVLIDRKNIWSEIPGAKKTTQPHREWIYRMSYEAGRHIIGYEVQKVLAGVDWFERQNADHKAPIGVTGNGEGGLIATYAAALDPRITASFVEGYDPRSTPIWKEPIYRDLWGILREGPVPKAGGDLAAFTRSLGVDSLKPAGPAPDLTRRDFDPAIVLRRQFDQLVGHTQAVIRRSPQKRAEFQTGKDPATMRKYVWEEVIGRMPDPNVPMNARSRQIFDEPKYRGYEVMLDVWNGVYAYGILLVPKDIRAGERRPVVVCQHGLEGRPRDVADPSIDSHYYHRYAVKLAEEGFVTFAPQNPYIGGENFRQIQRKGHPLKLSIFSFILGQHQRILEWLGDQPFVDRSRIGFYGLSYGGKTAMRVPSLLEGYALSICSADFNEWVWKTTSVDSKYSYMLTGEYDMLEYDFANVVNYSDLAALIAPRPFMVERGHDDQVAPDEWVAYEFAKVKRFYVKQGIGDRTEIEFFNGPHSINGKGTFAFLRKHLRWPQ